MKVLQPIGTHGYIIGATLLNDTGTTVKTIQAIIGRFDKTTINRYVHSRDQKKREAVRRINEMLIFSAR